MSNLKRACALLFCLLIAVSVASFAQEAPRAEIFVMYSYGHSHSRLGTTTGGIPVFVDDQPRGFEAGANYFFNSWFGFSGSGAANLGDNGNTATALLGPIFKIRTHAVQPFFMARAGIHHVNPASGLALDSNTGVGVDLGGGLDIRLNKRVDFRLIQADYIYAHHTYPLAVASRDWQGYRLGTGLVFKFGSIGPPPAPPTAACSAQPDSIFAGDPVTVTANAQGFPANRTLSYAWTASGGAKVSGKSQSTQVDTTGLAPGSYTVTSNITSNKKNEVATCSANFTVKERPRNAPTITCSAGAQTVKPGEPLSFSANASSPDAGVKIAKIDWTVSAGTISSGQGTNQISVDTSGANGTVTASAQATDDRGLTGACSATANVEAPAPPPPPPPAASKLNEIQFKNPAKPARVDNEAKAILDDVALRLQRDADAKAVVIGFVDPGEKNGQRLAQERAANTKAYLVQEKQIDASRIELRTGTAGGKRAEIWIVPAGATFSGEGTQTFTEKPAPAKRSGAGRAPAKTKKPAAPKGGGQPQ
jgi:hypothetical protein